MIETMVNNAGIAVPLLVAVCGAVLSVLVAAIGIMIRHFLRDMALTLQRIEQRVADLERRQEDRYVTKEMCWQRHGLNR